MRCEGWTRYGGAFTFGPVRWEQCPYKAVVMLEVTQKGKTTKVPGCLDCWQEAIDTGIKINSVVPLEKALRNEEADEAVAGGEPADGGKDGEGGGDKPGND